MRRASSLILFLGLLLTSGGPAFAQDSRPAEGSLLDQSFPLESGRIQGWNLTLPVDRRAVTLVVWDKDVGGWDLVGAGDIHFGDQPGQAVVTIDSNSQRYAADGVATVHLAWRKIQ